MTEYDIQNIDKQINEILNGTKDISRFNQSEHAGVCSAGSLLIGALFVCDIVRESFKTSPNAGESQTAPANWEIDKKQEQSIQEWAELKSIWVPKAEEWLKEQYGPELAHGAEATLQGIKKRLR